MNIDRLKMVCKSNETMAAMFNHWNSRCRDTKQVKIPRFKKTLITNGVRVDDTSMIRLFEILKEEGCGDFLRKNNRPIAFIWSTDLKRLASDVTGKPTRKERRIRLVRPTNNIILVVPTESGDLIKIGLKSDLSKRDIDNLSKAIRSIGA